MCTDAAALRNQGCWKTIVRVIQGIPVFQWRLLSSLLHWWRQHMLAKSSLAYCCSDSMHVWQHGRNTKMHRPRDVLSNFSCSSSSSRCSFFDVAAIKTLSKLFLVLFLSVFTSIICSLPFYLSPFLQEINISDLCCWWFVWFGNGVAEWKVD